MQKMYLFNGEAKNMIHYIFYIVEREIWQLPVPSVPCIIYAPYLSRVAPGTGMSIPVPAGSFSTTTMVKESFTTGNSEVSRRDMPSYLMRWLLVDKLQGEVTPRGSVRVCQKIIGFAARGRECRMRSCGKVSDFQRRPAAGR